MNRELIAARCAAGGLSIHDAAMKAWVDPALFWEDAGREGDDRIPVGVLRRLCRILDVDLTELAESRGPRGDAEDGAEGPPDDVRVEAALAEFTGGLSRDTLAEAFGWPLDRVERALAVLDERLAPTGRRLRPIGWHRYTLAPHLGVLTVGERTHLTRSTREGLAQDEAEAMFQIVRGFGSINLFRTGPGAVAVASLLRAGLIEQNRGWFVPSMDVVFSLGLDD